MKKEIVEFDVKVLDDDFNNSNDYSSEKKYLEALCFDRYAGVFMRLKSKYNPLNDLRDKYYESFLLVLTKTIENKNFENSDDLKKCLANRKEINVQITVKGKTRVIKRFVLNDYIVNYFFNKRKLSRLFKCLKEYKNTCDNDKNDGFPFLYSCKRYQNKKESAIVKILIDNCDKALKILKMKNLTIDEENFVFQWLNFMTNNNISTSKYNFEYGINYYELNKLPVFRPETVLVMGKYRKALDKILLDNKIQNEINDDEELLPINPS